MSKLIKDEIIYNFILISIDFLFYLILLILSSATTELYYNLYSVNFQRCLFEFGEMFTYLGT